MKIRKTKNERKTWTDKLDKVFSLYIRMRDSKPYRFSYFRCISCGRILPANEADAGHYISRNCMALRWEPMNVHSECRRCNRLLGDHLIGYRKNLIMKLGQQAVRGSRIAEGLDPHRKLVLIKKLGEQQVEALEARKKETRKWSVQEMQEQYMYFAALVLELKNQM